MRSLQGALKRAGWLPAGRAGRLPDLPQAYHSPRDEGALDPSRPSRHSYVVAVDREDEEAWIVDPLQVQPAQDLGVSFHAVQAPWPEKVAQKQNRSYLAVKNASAFMYGPTDEWRIPEPGELFDKDKSMPEQHQEEQRSTLEWLQGWTEIKVQETGKRRGRHVPKRPQIVSTAETTLKGRTAYERVHPAEQGGDDGGCGEAQWTGPRRDEERGDRPRTGADARCPGHGVAVLQYLARAGVVGLGAPESAVEQDPEGGDGGEGAVGGADGHGDEE